MEFRNCCRKWQKKQWGTGFVLKPGSDSWLYLHDCVMLEIHKQSPSQRMRVEECGGEQENLAVLELLAYLMAMTQLLKNCNQIIMIGSTARITSVWQMGNLHTLVGQMRASGDLLLICILILIHFHHQIKEPDGKKLCEKMRPTWLSKLSYRELWIVFLSIFMIKGLRFSERASLGAKGPLLGQIGIS